MYFILNQNQLVYCLIHKDKKGQKLLFFKIFCQKLNFFIILKIRP